MTNVTIKKRPFCLASGAVLLLLQALSLQAADENLEFVGTLVAPPPCSLSETGTVMVSFGDNVGVKKVASGIYRQPVALNLQCEESAQAWQLMLSVYGNAADFDADKATVVTAEQANLGVKLYAGGAPFELDTSLKINGNVLPAIEAVLVQRDGIELQEGGFTALATLRAEYQ